MCTAPCSLPLRGPRGACGAAASTQACQRALQSGLCLAFLRNDVRCSQAGHLCSSLLCALPGCCLSPAKLKERRESRAKPAFRA